jgi:signal transduction histidine kinase
MDEDRKVRRTIDTRMMPARVIPLVRLILGASMLLVFILDRRITGRPITFADGLLATYVLFGAGLYSLTRIHSPLVRRISNWEHWVDAATFSGLAILDVQKSVLFLSGLFFSFLVASARWGFTSATRVAAASATLCTASVLAAQLWTLRLDVNQLLIPFVTLLVLGGMVAYWGGFEIALKRRLEFISGVTRISNPRFGLGHVIGTFMEKLREYFDADTCIMVMAEPGEAEVLLRRVDKSRPGRGARAVSISQDTASRLLSLPPEVAVMRRSGPRFALLPRTGYFECDVVRGERTTNAKETSERLAVTADAASLLTVPLRYRNDTLGRIFLTSGRRCFKESDVYFLLQVFDLLMPVLDNIRLVDRMAADAGLAERKKIARDLHDSVIQPYIGLKLGMASLRQKLEAGTLQLSDIDRLITVNEEAVADLRGYISVLKGNVEQDEDLLSAVRRFVTKFSFATGISVDIQASDHLHVNDRLAAEALQIVAEGLSNIRRHTESMRARVSIGCDDGQLVLRIADVCSNGVVPEPYVPWSITERAEALGGKVRVEPQSHGGSTVVVEVPL